MTENPIPWRVIRAAPDMLEALKQALDALELKVNGPMRDDAIENARAAIAKAKGEKE
jgi:hypothetical protein